MEKNFNLQRIEPISPEVEQIGHFTLPEFAQNLDRTVPDHADRKIADGLIGFMLNKDISAAEAKTILASIQNSKNILHSTKELAQKAYNKINLKTENLVGIEKDKNQINIENARAVAHDAFIDILSKYFHGIKIENLESDKDVSEFLLKNYPDIITSIKLQDHQKIKIGDISLVEAAGKIEKNDPHSNYTFVSKMLVGYISGPEIRDSFVDDEGWEADPKNKKSAKKKRQDFIQKFRDGKDGPVRSLFESNKFKLSNIRNTVGSDVYEHLGIEIPENLGIQMQALYNEVNSPLEDRDGLTYDVMKGDDKEIVVAKADDISRKLLADILQKHLQ